MSTDNKENAPDLLALAFEEENAPDLLAFESNQQIINMLRFLINDHAFSTDFLITTISEYVIRNKKESK